MEGIDTIPNTDADNALILGTALHTGIEEGVEQALDFYKNSFPVLTDDHIHEMMKLEATRRNSNPAWYVDVAGMQTPIQVQKEQAHVLALIAHQNQKLIDRSETSKLLLAQIASVLVKQSFREPIATAARNVAAGR